MKVIYQNSYGPVSELLKKEIQKPGIKENEVLIKIHASAINDYDWSMVRGKPYLYRLMFGLFKPKNPIPGMELSGVIEAIGKSVTRFKVGDQVYGDISNYGFGSFAEYIAINEKAILPKPNSLKYEEAAALSHAGGLALQGLQDLGKLKAGDKVLINGGGGGMGIIAAQIANFKGAKVTGVDHLTKLEEMKAYGYDEVIDYNTTDFTELKTKFNLILDAKTNRSPFKYLNVLKPNGRYITVGGSLSRLIQVLFFKAWIKLIYKKNFAILALKANKDMRFLEALIANGSLRLAIDESFDFDHVPEAIQFFGEARHLGKVVITHKTKV
ncbi:NAD(P)-dependent alcohol dehydrogenase [Eudoraea chungangensis]|uniref:NAD(P)-dependent alcohol dehydrogenase n=1 Tax=Eudoraea chungangensis TaxID=1481905 RepID=UPI0023ED633C|nr:NAD(P)-dependent alcohol dehydrogenase [Eudoraea chungangensis]